MEGGQGGYEAHWSVPGLTSFLCVLTFLVCFEQEATRGLSLSLFWILCPWFWWLSVTARAQKDLPLLSASRAVLCRGTAGPYSVAEADEQVWGGAREWHSEKLPRDVEGASL